MEGWTVQSPAADGPSLARRELGPWAYALVSALVTALIFTIHLKSPRAVSGLRSTILAAPVGGEQWVVGTTVHVVLDHGDKPHPVLVQLSRDGGSTWEELIDLTTTQLKVYPWRVSGLPSDTCIMRVIDVSTGMRHASQAFTIHLGTNARGSIPESGARDASQRKSDNPSDGTGAATPSEAEGRGTE
jgi:hypothetical protein